MLELSTPVKYVKGVGPRIADVLAGKGIYTVGDLLYYLPFRYEDRLNPRGISELRPGEMATIVAEVRDSYRAGESEFRPPGPDPRGRALAHGTGIASQGIVERPLAGSGREPGTVAVVPHPGTHPDDL